MQSDMTGATSTNAAAPDSGIGNNTSNLDQDQNMTDAANVGTTPATQEHAISQPPTVQIPAAPDIPKVDPQKEQPVNVTIQPRLTPSVPTLSIQVPALEAVQPVPLIEEYTTKNLVVLDKFDNLSDQARHEYGLFFNSKRMAKLVQHRPEVCPITTQIARYRDPVTGIGYANITAYKVLQELKEHSFAWSGILGCYVGREGAAAARGVPEGYPG